MEILYRVETDSVLKDKFRVDISEIKFILSEYIELGIGSNKVTHTRYLTGLKEQLESISKLLSIQ